MDPGMDALRIPKDENTENFASMRIPPSQDVCPPCWIHCQGGVISRGVEAPLKTITPLNSTKGTASTVRYYLEKAFTSVVYTLTAYIYDETEMAAAAYTIHVFIKIPSFVDGLLRWPF